MSSLLYKNWTIFSESIGIGYYSLENRDYEQGLSFKPFGFSPSGDVPSEARPEHMECNSTKATHAAGGVVHGIIHQAGVFKMHIFIS